MSETPTVRSLHDEAMRHAMNAVALRARLPVLTNDEFDTMIGHYHAAWDLENQAVACLVAHIPDEPDRRQPTERILRRSAVACLFNALDAMKQRGEEEDEDAVDDTDPPATFESTMQLLGPAQSAIARRTREVLQQWGYGEGEIRQSTIDEIAIGATEEVASLIVAADGHRATTLQTEITEWANAMFGGRDDSQRWTKLQSEVAELGYEEMHGDSSGVANECADIMHLLFQYAYWHGFDLLGETRKKFEINKSRDWEPQPDGTYRHVKEGDDDAE